MFKFVFIRVINNMNVMIYIYYKLEYSVCKRHGTISHNNKKEKHNIYMGINTIQLFMLVYGFTTISLKI